ncbi:DUF3999 family protein [Sphingobacterium hungaricum]
MKKTINLIACILFSCALFAQDYSAAVRPAQTDGYQKIKIPQDIRSIIGNNLGMVRILDQNGNEVPYVQQKSKSNVVFIKNSSIKTEILPDSATFILLENSEQSKINSLTLQISNTTATKNYQIDGSNDQLTWYAVLNSGYLDDLTSVNQTYTEKNISFPLTSYRYIRIKLDDKNSSPLNILAIGKNFIEREKIRYELLTGVSFETKQNREKKQSTVDITLKNKTPIDFIELTITNPKQYQRNATLFVNANRTVKNKTSVYQQPITEFIINSNEKAFFPTNSTISDKIFLSIDDRDNPPLAISEVMLYQIPVEIIAELKHNEIYQLTVDTNWTSPDYDIASMDLALSDSLQNASVGSLSSNNSVKQGDQTLKENSGKVILWIGIFTGILIIFYFGYSLLKDMKKKEN